MKTIHETFDDNEMELLKRAKGSKTWHSFIMELAKKENSEEKELEE